MKDIKFVNILEVDDVLKERVRQWRNKEDVRRAMLTQHNISEEEHSGWLRRLEERDDTKFWVVFADKTPIGAAYLHGMDRSKSDSEWGFYIGEDEYRGKGLSKHILFKLLDNAFESMNLETLFTTAISHNTKALGIYKKFRFKEIDRIPFKDGDEIVLMGFTRGDWKKIKGKMEDELGYKNRE